MTNKTKDPNPYKRVTVLLSQDVMRIIEEKATEIDPSFPNISQAVRSIVLEWDQEKVVSIPIKGKLDSGWLSEEQETAEEQNDPLKRMEADGNNPMQEKS